LAAGEGEQADPTRYVDEEIDVAVRLLLSSCDTAEESGMGEAVVVDQCEDLAAMSSDLPGKWAVSLAGRRRARDVDVEIGAGGLYQSGERG
jgi:hypothetical protein